MKILMTWAVGLALVSTSSISAHAEDVLSKCERMAAFPHDPAFDGEGVPDHSVPMPLALTACEQARRLYCAYDETTHDGQGHAFYEVYFGEPLTCKET